MSYYPKIRELREDNDLTQGQIAQKLKMKQQQYQRYEAGYRDIPTEVVRELCLYYRVSADYLLDLPKGLKWPR